MLLGQHIEQQEAPGSLVHVNAAHELGTASVSYLPICPGECVVLEGHPVGLQADMTWDLRPRLTALLLLVHDC